MELLNITNDISSEIIIIYGLIGLVISLIVVVLLLDKKEKKKRVLLQTQELRLLDIRNSDEEDIEEFKKTEDIEVYEEVIVNEVNLKNETNQEEIGIETLNIDVDDDMYIEDDLEKTQAQLHLEALTNELKKAQETSIDKIAKFEEEQEENAIISYKELLKVCDKLYDSNDKVQYMDEGDEPITINQLRSKFSNPNKDIEVL